MLLASTEAPWLDDTLSSELKELATDWIESYHFTPQPLPSLAELFAGNGYLQIEAPVSDRSSLFGGFCFNDELNIFSLAHEVENDAVIDPVPEELKALWVNPDFGEDALQGAYKLGLSAAHLHFSDKSFRRVSAFMLDEGFIVTVVHFAATPDESPQSKLLDQIRVPGSGQARMSQHRDMRQSKMTFFHRPFLSMLTDT
jgi:hypothetical protein